MISCWPSAPARSRCPVVVGLTFEAADARLTGQGLQVGRAAPPFDDRGKAIVSRQVPEAGSSRPPRARRRPLHRPRARPRPSTGHDGRDDRHDGHRDGHHRRPRPATTGGRAPVDDGLRHAGRDAGTGRRRRRRRHQPARRRPSRRPRAAYSADVPADQVVELRPARRARSCSRGQSVTLTVSWGRRRRSPSPTTVRSAHGHRRQARGPADRRQRRESTRSRPGTERGNLIAYRQQNADHDVEHLGRQPGQAAGSRAS